MRITTPIPEAVPIWQEKSPFENAETQVAKAKMERVMRLYHPLLEVLEAVTDEGVPYICFSQEEGPGGAFCTTVEPYRPTYDTAPDAASMIAVDWGWVAYSHKRESTLVFGHSPAEVMMKVIDLMAESSSAVAEACLCMDEFGQAETLAILELKWSGRPEYEAHKRQEAFA